MLIHPSHTSSNAQPVHHFKHKRFVLGREEPHGRLWNAFGKRIVGINEIHVGNRGKTPLQSGVYIKIITLRIVLEKCAGKQIPRKRKF